MDFLRGNVRNTNVLESLPEQEPEPLPALVGVKGHGVEEVRDAPDGHPRPHLFPDDHVRVPKHVGQLLVRRLCAVGADVGQDLKQICLVVNTSRLDLVNRPGCFKQGACCSDKINIYLFDAKILYDAFLFNGLLTLRSGGGEEFSNFCRYNFQ